MLRMIKQARAAISMLSADEVRQRAEKPVHFGLVADSSGAYAEMEAFLVPGNLARAERLRLIERIHRAHDPVPPSQVDIVLYEPGISCPQGAYTYQRDHPESTVAEILAEKEELSLALARQYPVFRPAVIDGMIHDVARENAIFAVTTALPNIVPSFIEVPWLFGEFASDTAFLTANQMRMAFLIAGACGSSVGLKEQKFEMLGIAGGAFGWRALARELAGHVPFGGGLIPKGAIAYAGTYLAGKGLERLHLGFGRHTGEEQRSLYERGLERGRRVVREIRAS
jgi:hypothetical protein